MTIDETGAGTTDHLHAQSYLEPGDTVLVRLDAPANVMMMDDASYDAHVRGDGFKYYGGWVARDMITLWPPAPGLWHVVVDLGGRTGRVNASVQILRG